jgi:hydrogenase-4 component B
MSLTLILIALVGLAASGLPALLLRGNRRHGSLGAALSAALNLIASALGLSGLALFALAPQAAGHELSFAWGIPLGRFALGLDPLGAVFLIPILLISALGSIYGLAYWPQARHPGNARRLRTCWGLFAAAMMMVVLARDSVLFLMAWEIMALAAFILAATEDHKSDVRRAAWVYLVATHIGTLCLFGFFALLHASTGSFAIWDAAASMGPAADLPLTAMLILALIGFGMKSGLFPFHVWLPGAHANAPSHVSAMLSGVMLKMGLYGLFRITAGGTLIAHPPAWWGAVILSAGAVSALLGIAYAAAQQDYKRLLAYSSIENMGLIAMGLGLALLGQSAGRIEWVVLGFGAALFHVLNHSLFKPLLFMGAGSLLHAVHTRRMDRLGGLAKRMPLTFMLFVLGSIAICGLPPLNGFASELLLYVGLLGTTLTPAGSAWGWAALAVPALAAVGAMAVTAFVKLLSSVFQGAPRNAQAAHAHDPPATMRLPLLALALLCVTIGLFPGLLLPLLEPAVRDWRGSGLIVAAGTPETLSALAPWRWPTWAGAALLGGIAALALLMMLLGKRRGMSTPARAGTWDCGYARPTARMQYTGASFVQMLLDLGAWATWPRGGRLRLRQLFPHPKTFSRAVPDVILDRAVLPVLGAGRAVVVRMQSLQQGSVQAYLIYVLAIIVLLFLMG